MAAAEHGATFPMAKKLRGSMTHAQLHDFAVGSLAKKPAHVKAAKPGSLLAASQRGFSASHPSRNLGKFLHPKRA
jgi:hypothetical protein